MQQYLKYNKEAKIYDKLTNEYIKEIKAIKEYTIYETQSGDMLDGIAYMFYEDETYWWVIGIYNNIIDPFNLPNIIKIPEKIEVFRILDKGG